MKSGIIFLIAICFSYAFVLSGSARPEENVGQMPLRDIVITLNRMDPVVFSHVRHLGVDPKQQESKPARFSCRDCHPKPFEKTAKGPIGMEVPHEAGGCADCHNGREHSDGKPTAFVATTRCLTCHKPPAD